MSEPDCAQWAGVKTCFQTCISRGGPAVTNQPIVVRSRVGMLMRRSHVGRARGARWWRAVLIVLVVGGLLPGLDAAPAEAAVVDIISTVAGPPSLLAPVHLDIDVDSSGNVFIADTFRNRVFRLTPTGAIRFVSS